MAPLIGITSVPRIIKTLYDEAAPAQTATDAIVESVKRAGGVPLILPVVAPEHASAQLAGLGGVVLAGGQDVHPDHGGEPLHEGSWIHPDRDAHEFALYSAILERELPVLAICRGMQLINVHRGGKLDGHVEGHDAPVRAYEGHHRVHVVAGSRLADATGSDGAAVNTLHHQAVRTLADGLSVSATSPDGVIEAVETTGAPWCLAVQWHPELMGALPGGQDLFDALVRAASE